MTNRVAVLGFGPWGGALAHHLARKGEEVTVWSRNNALVKECLQTRKHPKLDPSVTLDPKLKITSDIKECASASIIVLAFPAKALGESLDNLKALGANDKLVISAIKGLESSAAETPVAFLSRSLKASRNKLAVISGPSFARDVALGTPVSLVAASDTLETATQAAQLFSSPHLRVYTSTDVFGVELGGIAKNVIAIAAGVCDALKFGPSARSALITRGLAEMMRLAEGLGAKSQTLCGLSGLGDLVMTATDDTSRNRSVGLRLGKGEALSDIIRSIGSEAEGVHTAPLLAKLGKDRGLELPITELVVKLVAGEIAPAKLAQELLSRPMKMEFV